MQKRFLNYAFMGICTFGIAGLYSCVDNAYDLNKEIDKTITVGGDLTLPGSSTEEMLLKDILELDETSTVVTNGNGDYSVFKTGNPSNSDVKVSEVNIIPDMSSFEGIEIDNIIFKDGEAAIPEDKSNINIKITQNGIEEDIVDLYSAIINKDEYSINLKIANSNNTNINGSNFTIKDGFEIVFPEYMTIEAASENYQADGNIIRFSNEQPFDNSGNLPIYFSINKITFGNENAENGAKFDKVNHSISLGKEITLKGNIASKEESYDVYTFTADVECNNINIFSANAIVNPDINIEIDPIEIDNLPDFLTGDNVVFDATDPRIFLTVSNDSPLDAIVNMSLVAEKNGAEGETVLIKNVKIPGGSENHKICIHQNSEMTIEGANDVIVVDNLGELIKNIPERIIVKETEANVVQEAYDIELGRTYNIDNTYEINTPLMFGGETNIEYTENMDGWSEDIEDVEFNQLDVKMKAVNKIPMGLTLSAEAIDIYGNVMSNVSIEVEGNIEASNGEEATEKEILVVIKTNDGSRIKNLDGLKIKVNGTATDETSKVCLNENQSLKLDNVKLKLTGGITMDLN